MRQCWLAREQRLCKYIFNNKEQNCSVDESNIVHRLNTRKTHLSISRYCLEGHLFEYSFIKLPSKASQIK